MYNIFSARNEKELIGFATGWQRALIALSLITSAGGFVFGAMTFTSISFEAEEEGG